MKKCSQVLAGGKREDSCRNQCLDLECFGFSTPLIQKSGGHFRVLRLHANGETQRRNEGDEGSSETT
jgi:hypothetical protein